MVTGSDQSFCTLQGVQGQIQDGAGHQRPLYRVRRHTRTKELLDVPGKRIEEPRSRRLRQIERKTDRAGLAFQPAGKTEIRAFAYDYRLQPLEMTSGTVKFPKGPTGEQTDIGTTLNEALKAVPMKGAGRPWWRLW